MSKHDLPVPSGFTLRYPPCIRFGWGCRRDLPEVLKEAVGLAPVRVFLVAARAVLSSPDRKAEWERLCGPLAGTAAGIPHDPPLEEVDRLAERIRASGATAVVAAGGGSVMDAAKAAAAVAPTGKPVQPYFDGALSLASRGLPLVAVPTTAGSGAEITCNAVLSDLRAGVKKSLRSPLMIAAAAVVDPELAAGAPPDIIAWSGLDALTQAVESYLSRNANEATRPLARDAVVKLMRHLPAAVAGGAATAELRDARTGVAAGSLLSAMAFSQSSLGAVHGLAHPLGLKLNLAHGLTCAILLPHVLRLNAPVCGERLGELAAAVTGRPDPAGFVTAVSALCRRLHVPASFAHLGLTPAQFPEIIRDCRSASMKSNPRDLADGEVEELLRLLAG